MNVLTPFLHVLDRKKQKHQIQWNSYRVNIAHSDRQTDKEKGEQGHPACARPAADTETMAVASGGGLVVVPTPTAAILVAAIRVLLTALTLWRTEERRGSRAASHAAGKAISKENLCSFARQSFLKLSFSPTVF